MSNKGFTLVELLATLVVLSLVLGIATYGVIGTIGNAKNKNEEIFVNKLGDSISEYIDLEGINLDVLLDNANNTEIKYEFVKCLNSSCSYNEESYAYELESINISDLANKGFFNLSDIVNPVNNYKCFESKDPLVRVFKDKDYVYYYYVDFGGDNTNCEISEKNGIINTLSDKLYEVVKTADALKNEENSNEEENVSS